MEKEDNQKYEENPFEDPQVAEEWVSSVENEKDMFRDNEIYPMLTKWVNENKPGVVVEIGCGQGICSEKIQYSNGEYIGVEPSKPLVVRANDLYRQDNRDFVVGNAYEIPLQTEIADAVFSVNVWFHLENVDKASKELARILKSGGRFLIITANPNDYKTWESFYFDHDQDEKKIIGKVNVPVNPMSKSIFYKHSLDDITEALNKAGLKIDKVKGFAHMDEQHEAGLFIEIEGFKD